MPLLLFKLSCVPQEFLPAKRTFCPFCHIYARALFSKTKFLQGNQAKTYVFYVELQELSDAIIAF